MIRHKLKHLSAALIDRFSPTASPRFYAQHGEDAVLWSLLATTGGVPRSGFYVDIGAFDPVRFSNTYKLYRWGWHGIVIDANPAVRAAFRLLRPRDIAVHAAISSHEGMLNLQVLGTRSVMNTLDPARAQRLVEEHGLTATAVAVPSMRLATLLERHHSGRGAIDVLSVDVEGHDLSVLESNDWDRFRPRLVLAESHVGVTVGTSTPTPIAAFMARQGYQVVAWTPPTVFFERKS